VGKNVAVFVDVANIFYAAKAAGVDIDYVTLLKASSAGRDLVRAYAYTGLDPDNENQRNFHDFLRRHGYKVVSKDIRKYGDGKVKANLDIELVVDMMKTARNLDIAIVVSGDGDFAPAIRAVQEQGVRVEVVSFRGNTSSDLMDVADQFTDITQIAKVEKGSSRSGRRVATDDEDLSMTEVPDKQSEGTGERSRGRGRTRRTPAAATASPSRSRGRAAVASDGAEAPIVVLPGEKLSRVAAVAAEPAASDIDVDEAAEAEGEAVVAGAEGGTDEAAAEEVRRRRRRRGGRGRGRGRGREEGPFGDEVAAAPGRVAAAGEDADEPEDEAPSPARRPASAFGSVWDSQIGIPASLSSPVVPEDEDFEEPAVPEYLIAERRQRDSGRGGRPGAGRGRGGAYAAALDRERFGGGRGSTPSRFAEPPPRERDQGFNRNAGFNRNDRPDRERRDRPPFRSAPRPAPRGSGDEPWSEVPPEIEAMLRAQLGSRSAPAPRRDEPAMSPPAMAAPAPSEAEAPTQGSAPRRGRKAAGAAATGEAGAAPAADGTATRRAPARRSRTSGADAPAEASPSVGADSAGADSAGADSAATEAAPAVPRRRTTTRTATRTTTRANAPAVEADATASETPKRRTTRRKAEPAA
jgi:uncharacterized LabA/DUF88 family protein